MGMRVVGGSVAADFCALFDFSPRFALVFCGLVAFGPLFHPFLYDLGF